MQAPAHFQGEGNLGQSWLTGFPPLGQCKAGTLPKAETNSVILLCYIIRTLTFSFPSGLSWGALLVRVKAIKAGLISC